MELNGDTFYSLKMRRGVFVKDESRLIFEIFLVSFLTDTTPEFSPDNRVFGSFLVVAKQVESKLSQEAQLLLQHFSHCLWFNLEHFRVLDELQITGTTRKEENFAIYYIERNFLLCFNHVAGGTYITIYYIPKLTLVFSTSFVTYSDESYNDWKEFINGQLFGEDTASFLDRTLLSFQPPV